MRCEFHFGETMHCVWDAVEVSMIIILHAHSLCEMTYSVLCCTLIVNVIQCCYNGDYARTKMHLEVLAAVCTLKCSFKRFSRFKRCFQLTMCANRIDRCPVFVRWPVRRRLLFSKIFSSETTWSVVAKLHVDYP